MAVEEDVTPNLMAVEETLHPTWQSKRPYTQHGSRRDVTPNMAVEETLHGQPTAKVIDALAFAYGVAGIKNDRPTCGTPTKTAVYLYMWQVQEWDCYTETESLDFIDEVFQS